MRASKRVTPIKIGTLKEPGLYTDGQGLYRRIGPTAAKSGFSGSCYPGEPERWA